MNFTAIVLVPTAATFAFLYHLAFVNPDINFTFGISMAQANGFVQKVEAACPDQRMKPRLEYHNPCVERVVNNQ